MVRLHCRWATCIWAWVVSIASPSIKGIGYTSLVATSAIGNNFCNFLFALQHINLLLKKGLLYKERICSPEGANSFLIEYTPIQKWTTTILQRVVSLPFHFSVSMIMQLSLCSAKRRCVFELMRNLHILTTLYIRAVSKDFLICG